MKLRQQREIESERPVRRGRICYDVQSQELPLQMHLTLIPIIHGMKNYVAQNITRVCNKTRMGCYGAVVLLAVTTCSFAMSLEENASLNKNRYTRLYPKLDEREWTRNSLCWASDRLQEVGEKALYPLTTFGETHYRVLCTQMGKGVFCVRISVAPRSHRISCYTWHSSKKGLLLHGKSTAILTDNDPSVLSPLLNTSDFWTLPPFPHKLMYVDGVRWFIEAVQDGKYHMIYLESEAEGKMRDFCSAVCRLAKNTCKTVARDIDMILGKLKLKGVND